MDFIRVTVTSTILLHYVLGSPQYTGDYSSHDYLTGAYVPATAEPSPYTRIDKLDLPTHYSVAHDWITSHITPEPQVNHERENRQNRPPLINEPQTPLVARFLPTVKLSIDGLSGMVDRNNPKKHPAINKTPEVIIKPNPARAIKDQYFSYPHKKEQNVMFEPAKHGFLRGRDVLESVLHQQLPKPNHHPNIRENHHKKEAKHLPHHINLRPPPHLYTFQDEIKHQPEGIKKIIPHLVSKLDELKSHLMEKAEEQIRTHKHNKNDHSFEEGKKVKIPSLPDFMPPLLRLQMVLLNSVANRAGGKANLDTVQAN